MDESNTVHTFDVAKDIVWVGGTEVPRFVLEAGLTGAAAAGLTGLEPMVPPLSLPQLVPPVPADVAVPVAVAVPAFLDAANSSNSAGNTRFKAATTSTDRPHDALSNHDSNTNANDDNNSYRRHAFAG